MTELEATYLMWLDVSAAVPDVGRLQEALVSVGKVAIMDGSIYGGNGQRFLRLNIGCSQAKLHEDLKGCAKVLKLFYKRMAQHQRLGIIEKR